jgi:hypothetical protein
VVHLQEDVAALLSAEVVGLDAEDDPVWDAARLVGDWEVESPLLVGAEVGEVTTDAAALRVYQGSTGPESVTSTEVFPAVTNCSTHVPCPSAPNVQDSKVPLSVVPIINLEASSTNVAIRPFRYQDN